MGLFNNKSESQGQQPPRNPSNTIAFRLLAIGYVSYLCVNMVKLYLEGGPDAPSLPLLIGGLAILVAGVVFLAVISWKEWKTGKAAYDAYMAELRAEAEAKRAAEEAAANDDEEYEDDFEEDLLPEGAEEPEEE